MTDDLPQDLELFFDTETTGLVLWDEADDHPEQPDIVQLGMILSTKDRIYAEMGLIITPDWDIHEIGEKAFAAHGISVEDIARFGVSTEVALNIFTHYLQQSTRYVCHNTSFDVRAMGATYLRSDYESSPLDAVGGVCTMKSMTKVCRLPGPWRGAYKWPTLMELHMFLFNEPFEGAHDALSDVRATRRCYYEIMRRELI